MFIKYSKKPTTNSDENEKPNGLYLLKDSPVFLTIMNWFMAYQKDLGYKPKSNVLKLLSNGILIGFNSNDFINPSSYKGFVKLYKCNSNNPKLTKMYFGKKLGYITLLGFKITDYDRSMNYLLVSKIEFLAIMKEKMAEEFVRVDKEGVVHSWSSKLYLGDDDVQYDYQYNRDWEEIRGLTSQEKIVLANKHNEEAFPNSLYENDNGAFSYRTQSDEYNIRFSEEYEPDKVDNSFDYGDYQEFSDQYTRTKTLYEDYELYPIRVNCLPKAVRKRGKSPYDTKLGIRQYIWHNMFKKPVPLDSWKYRKDVDYKPKALPKYNWERGELEVEYDLPENFWEDIEMAYRSR